LLGLWLAFKALRPAKPAPVPPAIPVVVAVAQVGDVPVLLAGLGMVRAYITVTVHVQVSDVLDAVVFTEGQDVKAGQLLARIDPRPYAALLAVAVAEKTHDEALLANARVDLRRYDELVRQNAIARQQRDTQAALVSQDAASVQGDQAQIDIARLQLAHTAITSPIRGRTGVRLIDAGNLVQATNAGGLVVMTQMEPISMLFTLPEDEVGIVNRQLAASSPPGRSRSR
jgi:multidrug efflux system membrane fusion protein